MQTGDIKLGCLLESARDRNTLPMRTGGQDSPRSLAQHAGRREAGRRAFKGAAGRPQPRPDKGAVAAADEPRHTPCWAASVVRVTLASALLCKHLLAEHSTSEQSATSSVGYTAFIFKQRSMIWERLGHGSQRLPGKPCGGTACGTAELPELALRQPTPGHPQPQAQHPTGESSSHWSLPHVRLQALQAHTSMRACIALEGHTQNLCPCILPEPSLCSQLLHTPLTVFQACQPSISKASQKIDAHAVAKQEVYQDLEAPMD